ncbi:MAG: hypothetical protein R2748_23325 [Bryobacterales bacterium]
MLIAVTDPTQVGVQHGEPLTSPQPAVAHTHTYSAEMVYEALGADDNNFKLYESVQPGTVVQVAGESTRTSLQALPCRRQLAARWRAASDAAGATHLDGRSEAGRFLRRRSCPLPRRPTRKTAFRM